MAAPKTRNILKERTSNQKEKLLYLLEFFLKHTDENHPATMQEILAWLAQHDINAERKSLYADFEAFTLWGFTIDQTSDRKKYFYAGQKCKPWPRLSRNFTLAELKMLMDSAQASKFITEKQTRTLIEKMRSLCSEHDARALQRGVVLTNRVKNAEDNNENINLLHHAICENHQVTFRYFHYDSSKKRQTNKKAYIQNPFALIYTDDHYYLLAFDHAAEKFKHFRVDRMITLAETNEPRVGREQFEKLDMGAYTQRTFSMFSGRTEKVSLQFINALADVVIDRFGVGVTLFRVDENHFRVTIEVAVSEQFYGWVFGLGKKVKILSPQSVVDEMSALLEGVRAAYPQG